MENCGEVKSRRERSPRNSNSMAQQQGGNWHSVPAPSFPLPSYFFLTLINSIVEDPTVKQKTSTHKCHLCGQSSGQGVRILNHGGKCEGQMGDLLHSHSLDKLGQT